MKTIFEVIRELLLTTKKTFTVVFNEKNVDGAGQKRIKKEEVKNLKLETLNDKEFIFIQLLNGSGHYIQINSIVEVLEGKTSYYNFDPNEHIKDLTLDNAVQLILDDSIDNKQLYKKVDKLINDNLHLIVNKKKIISKLDSIGYRILYGQGVKKEDKINVLKDADIENIDTNIIIEEYFKFNNEIIDGFKIVKSINNNYDIFVYTSCKKLNNWQLFLTYNSLGKVKEYFNKQLSKCIEESDQTLEWNIKETEYINNIVAKLNTIKEEFYNNDTEAAAIKESQIEELDENLYSYCYDVKKVNEEIQKYNKTIEQIQTSGVNYASILNDYLSKNKQKLINKINEIKHEDKIYNLNPLRVSEIETDIKKSYWDSKINNYSTLKNDYEEKGITYTDYYLNAGGNKEYFTVDKSATYKITELMIFSNDNYDLLINNLMLNMKILENKGGSDILEDGSYLNHICILATTPEGDRSVLIDPQGYSYARYIGIADKEVIKECIN